MKKFAITGVVVCAVLAAGFFWKKHDDSASFIQSLAPHVKNSSIRVANTIQFEAESSQITFKELFDKVDADVAEMERRIIEVQSVGNVENEKTVTPTVAYLKGCQEVSRSIAMKYRKTLAFTNAIDHSGEAIRDMKSASSYSYGYAKDRSVRAINEMAKIAGERDEAIKEVVSAASKLKTLRSAVEMYFAPDALIAKEKLDLVIEKNTTKEEDGGKK